jgi:putative ABC transport system ATP-binding protein
MIIQTEALTKVYRTTVVETTAVNGIDLCLEEGQFVSITGPSGCGKSTLLHVLGLIDGPTGGRYRFLGEDVSGYTERRRARLRKAHIGVVFQSFNLIEELTVQENVALPLVYAGMAAHERRRRVEAILERVDMAHRHDQFPAQLSGGQQQRVAIARAVVNRPQLLLADEPTGNLDSEHGREVMKLLLELNEAGTTVLMVTHSPEYAAFSRRVISLRDGKIVADRAPGHR